MQHMDGVRGSGVSLVCVAFVAAFGATACKRSSSDGATGATGSATLAAAATLPVATSGNALCSLVSASEATNIIGGPPLQAPEAESVGPVTICKYSDGKYSGALTLRFETGRDLSEFAIIRKGHDEHGQPTTDYPGLGEAAFTISIGSIHGVSTLGKKTVMLVQGDAPHDKLAQLARVILQRL